MRQPFYFREVSQYNTATANWSAVKSKSSTRAIHIIKKCQLTIKKINDQKKVLIFLFWLLLFYQLFLLNLPTWAWLEGDVPHVLRKKMIIFGLFRAQIQNNIKVYEQYFDIRIWLWSQSKFTLKPTKLVEDKFNSFVVDSYLIVAWLGVSPLYFYSQKIPEKITIQMCLRV